ncbi:MAG TPA: hypothetical protein RMH99_24520 [Sandaracinaceae bacterium LLY-WYZ-13_1]|nr:hypothetical protein [Sandaracinaceae bacterium LLY-WYZ-13_1]
MSRYDADEPLDDEESKSSRPGMPVDPTRLLRAVLRGKWWLLIAAVIGSVAGVLIGKFVVQHTYEATTSMRYEGLPGQDPREVQRELPAMVSITHSEPIMIALREERGMGEASLDLMRRMVQVQSDASSGLVSFTTTGHSPEGAAEMANSLRTIFLDHHRESRSTELRDEMASLDERIDAAEDELQRARSTYDDFRETHGITDLSAEQEQAINQAAELRSDADLAQAEIEALEARVQQLERQLEETPQTETVSSGSSRSQRRLAELQQRLREARGQGLSDNHPQVQSLQRQVEALERSGAGSGGSSRTETNSLYTQIESNLAEARTELEAARRRHESLQTLATQAQERTNRFSTIEGQAAGLLAQVNTKEALLNELNERKARIEDSLRDVQTGFRTVAEARPPESAVPSKKKWVVAAGIPMAFVSIMLAMLFFRELRGLRIQTPREVAWWGNGPVIGTTTWPRDPRALIDLIADMDDFAPDARGTMLVVGATDDEHELAAEVASQLNHDWSSTTLIDVPVVGALPPGEDADPPPRSDPAPSYDQGGYDYDGDVISGEIHDGPTEIVLHDDPHGDALAGMDAPTEVDGVSPVAPPQPVDDPDERLVCTAWTGPEGQSLRRAARLADRVLVLVRSNGLKATELAQQKTRLGRERAVGYCLIGVTDEVARLPDRSGPVEEFWDVPTAR